MYTSPARARPTAAHAVSMTGLMAQHGSPSLAPPFTASSLAGGTTRPHRTTNRLEVVLLLVGLMAVFVMGLFMSTHLHVLDQGISVMRTAGGRGKEGGAGYDAAILEDYMKAREKLRAMVAELRPMEGGETLTALVSQLELVLKEERRRGGEPPQPVIVPEAPQPAPPPPPPPQEAAPQPLVMPKPAPKQEEGRQTKKKKKDSSGLPWKAALEESAMLVICFDRADYLERTLTSLHKYHPGGSLVPLIVSEDGHHQNVQEVVKKYKDKFAKTHPKVEVIHIHHNQDKVAENGYFLLASHYKWALNQVFRDLKSEHPRLSSISKVIILEEDLDIAPDFFNYFGSLAHFLDDDPNLLTISAWNDNGMNDRVHDPQALYRSDFFPGLGWMMSRGLWEELEPKWPRAYWDDWLREPPQRKGRQVIRPEVSRTYHFGVRGTSSGQYSIFLEKIKLNDQPVAFDQMDLSYLEGDRYQKEFMASVSKAKEIAPQNFHDVTRDLSTKGGEVKLFYGSLAEFEQLAQRVGVMDNIKASVPRTAYQGVVTFRVGKVKVHLVPRTNMY